MRRPAVLLTVLVGAGCSTAAEPPPGFAECETDEECPDAQFCAPQGICLDSTGFAPLKYLGFDIQESLAGQLQFRSEVLGCDEEVLQNDQAALEVARPVVTQTLELSVFLTDASATDPDPDAEPVPLPASFELSQASRLARAELRRQASHVMPEDETSIPPARIQWPRYHPDDRQPAALHNGGFILWTVSPLAATEDEPDRGSMLAMLNPPAVLSEPEDGPWTMATCEESHGVWLEDGRCRPEENPTWLYKIEYEEVCDRRLRGEVVRITSDFQQGSPLVGATIGVRHASDPDGEDFGLPAIGSTPVDERPPQCSTDDDCVAGQQFCDPASRQCFLDLAGRNAASSSATGESGEFSARVYTYCEGQEATDVPRGYTISVTPPKDSALPSLNYAAEAVFPPPFLGPGDKPDGIIGDELCVPDWGPPRSLRLALSGAPVELLPGDEEAPPYSCCDVGCLPSTADEAEMTMPSSVDACTGRTSEGQAPLLRLETPARLSPQDALAWMTAGCLLPTPGDDNVVGTLARNAECLDEPTPYCEATGLAAGTDGEGRAYRLRVESPVRSLFRSVDMDIEVRADADPSVQVEIPLQRRVLVRGLVTLPPEACNQTSADVGDCGSDGAVVLAERLRMPGEDPTNTPGPYFHDVSTFFDPRTETSGHYVLPLDPGVWILTALPAPGTLGGPARYVVLELGEQAAEDGVDFVLDQGNFVTLELGSFDRRTTLAPLDGGTWKDAPLEHPGRRDDPDPVRRQIHLDDIEECLANVTDADQACKIRRLIPGASLTLGQVGQASFSARLAPGVEEDVARDCR